MDLRQWGKLKFPREELVTVSELVRTEIVKHMN